MCKSSLHRECLQCGTTFETTRKDKMCCSHKCAQKRWREANSGAIRKWRSGYYLANKDTINGTRFYKDHGITIEERDRMFAEQDGKCKVCDDHMTLEAKKPNSAHLDHCHSSEERHALLCARCNKASGLLGENPEITAKLTAYLLDTGKVPTR